jgi:hypothetical protein
MFFLDLWVIKEIKDEFLKILKFNENESIIYPNLWDTAMSVQGESL